MARGGTRNHSPQPSPASGFRRRGSRRSGIAQIQRFGSMHANQPIQRVPGNQAISAGDS